MITRKGPPASGLFLFVTQPSSTMGVHPLRSGGRVCYSFLRFFNNHSILSTNQSVSKNPMRKNTPQLIRKRINIGSLKKGKVSKNDISKLPRNSTGFPLKFFRTYKNSALLEVSHSVHSNVYDPHWIRHSAA